MKELILHFHGENLSYTEGEGQIYDTLLLRLCDLVAHLVLILCMSFGLHVKN